MAQHTINLSDEQELGLQWRVRCEGLAVDVVLDQWIAAGANESNRDLAARLGALKGVPAAMFDDLRAKLLGMPDSRDQQIAELLARIADLESKLKP